MFFSDFSKQPPKVAQAQHEGRNGSSASSVAAPGNGTMAGDQRHTGRMLEEKSTIAMEVSTS